jgi:molybdate transport system permease protein
MQSPSGDLPAARLASISIALGLIGLLLSEWLTRRMRRLVGR